MSMFLDLAITERCNLNCVHCFWKDKRDLDMPVDMVEDIVMDYMSMSHPVPGRMVLISGGEPTCHPNFADIIELFHEYGWRVNIASNGFKIPEYVESGVLCAGDAVQISVDGMYEQHDIIRGYGSFKQCLNALEVLTPNGIEPKVHFTLHGGGSKRMVVDEGPGKKVYRDIPIAENIGHVNAVAKMAKEYGAGGFCVNYYHPIARRGLLAPSKQKFVRAQRIAEKYYMQPPHCYLTGCVAGLLGVSTLADGTYWNCSRSQKVLGKYPQLISEVLDWGSINVTKHNRPADECMRFVREDRHHVL